MYRGWMLAPDEYEALLASLDRLGAKANTSLEQYLSTPYLPNWHPALARLEWPRFFVKDYVKSLKTAGGSVIERPEDIGRVMAEMRKFRGVIEGGLCVRRFEAFVPDSERRYFVIERLCFASDPKAEIPPIVEECARRLSSPFFSADVAMRTDGVERLVEVGDGQVSILVGWTAGRFAALWDDTRLES